MRQTIINTLQEKDVTHSELLKILETNLQDKFFDNISWYAETVILDLEARELIEKTDKYHLK